MTESSSGETKDYIAGAMSSGASALERDAMVVRARRMAARQVEAYFSMMTNNNSENSKRNNLLFILLETLKT